MAESETDAVVVSQSELTKKKTVISLNKNGKKGVIYLNYVPPGLTVKKIRDIFTKFGEVGRIFLEPSKSRRGITVLFDEGWIEFKKKRIAKLVASTLNGTQVGGKRRNIFYDSIWSIKYLHRFKWNNLTEQMNYERSQRSQRLRFEMGQVKKESDFYAEQVDELKRRKRKDMVASASEIESRSGLYSKTQRMTEDQIIKKSTKKKSDQVDDDLIARIFS
ncbi:Activator of basal transcription 1 [Halotydeus destructor]|nr:Activator of basal transcription 1 [Halotydeus destructor]